MNKTKECRTCEKPFRAAEHRVNCDNCLRRKEVSDARNRAFDCDRRLGDEQRKTARLEKELEALKNPKEPKWDFDYKVAEVEGRCTQDYLRRLLDASGQLPHSIKITYQGIG